jgi:translation initiation factor IF-2
MGNNIDTAEFSSPIQLIGFDKIPSVGSRFATFETKKDAEQAISEFREIEQELAEGIDMLNIPEGTALVPIILKTDVAGTGEAIAEHIESMTSDDVIFKIIKKETGSINESDVKIALSDPNTVIIGFHVDEDANIKNINDYESLVIKTFDIIYKLTQWIQELYDQRRIKKEIDTMHGQLKVLKNFSSQQGQTLVGGSIITGAVSKNEQCKIIRRDELIGRGKIIALQQGKTATDRVLDAGTECGVMVETTHNIIQGDIIETYTTEIK